MLRNKIITAITLVILLAFLGGCPGKSQQNQQTQGKGTDAGISSPASPTEAPASSFAAYEEVPVSVVPAVKPCTVAGDLGNVTNEDMFQLSDSARDLLSKNGFVVVPNSYFKEFFWLYEENRYRPAPSFITTDSMLHNYHLFFAHLLRVIETEQLVPELKNLNQAMLSAAQKQYVSLKGTPWENAARRNVGFFAVGASLLDPGVAAPASVRGEVERELALISEHEGIALSPVMNMGGAPGVVEGLKEDYSQYIPRGHYDKTEALKAYFKAMMWYGRLTFRLKNEDETKSAALMTLALGEGDNLAAWKGIYEPTSFLVGKSDDISPIQFRELMDETFGSRVDLKTLVSDQAGWTAFLDAAARLEPPAINSMPIFDEAIQPDREREIKGFRFMGQRFTVDASIFQRLVYREVKENGNGQRRMLPKGLDIPAALGSAEAYDILESMGETGYRNYPENIARLKAHIAGLDQKTWTQNLYWGWLYSILPLAQEKPEGYPSFMRNSAWARKDLNTFLGSWVELKHDTILYSKPVYAEAGGGDMGVDDRGYVEPNPPVYARLASLAKMTREGLKSRGLLNEKDEASLERLETLALSLKAIAEKELSDTPLTDAEYDLIRAYGVQLEHFWLEALRDEGFDHRSQSSDQPAAVIADVATDPGGQVLEEATGNIFEIYAVVPVDGNLRIARGGVYSYYEFPWPLNDRLTDSEWRQMLNDGKTPPLPGWTKAFVAR
ncbi:MAG: DUF3160 domain-containing protein [Ignavibacteriales bacterium]